MQEQEKHSAKNTRLWKLTGSYKKAYEPDVAKGLTQLKSRIAKDKTKIPAKTVSLRTWLSRVAAVAILLVGATLAYQTFFNSQPTIQELQATDAMIAAYQLPDGSEIWLNKNSQLNFPEVFDAKQRVVTLEGEAFFKIAKDTQRPFIVNTGATRIEVLGTTFNLRAYQAENITALKVVEGKVAFQATSTGKQEIVAANEKANFDKTEQVINRTLAANWQDTAWMPKNLDFDNTPLAEIIDYLATNFEVTIELANPSLADCPLLATLVDNNPDAIIKSIKRTFPVKMEVITSKKYRLTGNCSTE